MDFLRVLRRRGGDRVQTRHELTHQFDDFLGRRAGGRVFQEEIKELALLHPSLLLLGVGFADGGGEAGLVGGISRTIVKKLGELVGWAVEGQPGRQSLPEGNRGQVLRNGHLLVTRESGGLQQGGHGGWVIGREDPQAVAALVGQAATSEGDREMLGILLAGRGTQATSVDEASREGMVLVVRSGHESTPQDAERGTDANLF